MVYCTCGNGLAAVKVRHGGVNWSGVEMNQMIHEMEKLAVDVVVPFGCDRRVTKREVDPQWAALERRSKDNRRCVVDRRERERRDGRDRRSPERLRAEAHRGDRRIVERRRREGRRGGYFRSQMMMFDRDSKEVSSRLMLPANVISTREYHCSRQSSRVYHVHAYDQGEYVGTYPVYRNEVNSSYMCTCANFMLQFPATTGPCIHIQRVEEFTGGPSV